MNNLLLVSYTAEGTIPNYRITKPGSGASEKTVVVATALTDSLMGTTDMVGPTGVVAGERVDICLGGIPLVEAGGAFARGVLLTSDAQGRAIHATPSVGSNARIIGVSDQAATAAGDIVRYVFSPGVMQG